MAKERILVVDDEEDLLELARYNLAREGFNVQCVASGEEGLLSAQKTPPDLVVLDLMLPGIDGLDVCRRLKGDAATRAIPVIMVTAKGEEADVVTGLELGADDYLIKPFSPRVLIARVKAVLRRRAFLEQVPDEKHLKIGDLEIDLARHRVVLKGALLDLTHTEFKLLHLLARQPGWVFTRGQIVDGVHGDDYPVTDRSVDVQIVGLRRKLGDYGKRIETVRGVGYRFKE